MINKSFLTGSYAISCYLKVSEVIVKVWTSVDKINFVSKRRSDGNVILRKSFSTPTFVYFAGVGLSVKAHPN